MAAMAGGCREQLGVRIAPAELRFRDAVPGRRYRAALTVQNLRVESCRLHLLPPHRPQFKLVVENPEKPIASGLQLKAFVEYYPDRLEDLQDKLILLVDDDVVDIPLLGFIPYCCLEIESEIDFGQVIASNKVISKEISIANHGSSSGVFEISYDGVVLASITPTSGLVKPKSKRTIQVDICTDVPRVIKEVMKVELEGRGCTEVWVKAVVVEQVLKVLGASCGKVVECINFGPVYFGTSKTEQISLYNKSPENMDWVAVLEDNAIGGEMGTDLQRSTDAALQDLSLKNRDADVSTLILCTPNQGTLLPHEKSLVTLCFSPEKFKGDFEVNDSSLKQDYVLFLRFETVGNRDGYLQALDDGATATTRSHPHHVDLALTGSGLPVMVTFNPGPEINFRDCYLGEQTELLCTLKNESDSLPVTFRFRKAAHFNISPEKGKIKKNSAKDVMISFSPRQIGTFNMKQIIDIIGTGVDKNNLHDLKTISFHQLYLNLIGVCKAKRKKILFTVNPGLTPVISNATGQFVVDGTEECTDAARGAIQCTDPPPVAMLRSNQTRIHTHRINRNCKDDALIAFPNDRATSVRPGEWDKKYRTIFTKTERYNFIDPEFAYTDSERKSIEAHKKYYDDFISSLRQHRLEKDAARQFDMYNDPVSIGIKPGEGLKSPNISITDFPMEKLRLKKPPLNDDCLLTSRKLATITSTPTNKETWSWLSPVPSSTQEKEDCSLTLTHKQLHQIFIGPSTIDFGDVCVYSTTTKELYIINNLLVHIWIQIEIEIEELQETSPLSQVVPPLTKTHVPIVFETITPGSFKRSFAYKINNQHPGHVLVVANAVPIELKLSTRELILNPVPGCLAGTEFRATVRVCNPRNHPAGFIWKPVTTDRKPAFSIRPARGLVEAYSDLECEVVWRPGFNSPEEGEFILCVRKGNEIKLKCFAKLGATKVQFVTQNISFIHSPMGLSTCKTAILQNTGRNHAYFQVHDPNPLPGMTITPSQGVVPVGGTADLKISFTPNANMTFDKNVEVEVRSAGAQVLRVGGFVEVAEISMSVERVDFGGVYVGATSSIPFLLQNKGQSRTRVEFDFSKNKDFKLDTNDHSVIECCSSKPYFYSVNLKEESALECFLTFVPKEVAAYHFTLPVSTPQADSSLTALVVSASNILPPQPPAAKLPVAPPRCIIKAIALNSLVKFSSMELKFEQHSSDMNFGIADERVTSQDLDLKNISRNPLTWKLNCDDADKNIEDGVFDFSLQAGSLPPGAKVSIAVSFCPPCPGTYTSEISVYVNDNPSPYKITLSGTLKSPKLNFDPPFLIMMPVPLDVETEADINIIPQDYLRQSQIHFELPQIELEDGDRICPFSVQFPKGLDIVVSSDGKSNQLICHIIFRSSKPVSFLGNMCFIDEEENRFSIQIAATAENCLLTLYPYLAFHCSDQKITLRSHCKDSSSAEVVLHPCFTPQSPSHSISSSSFGGTSGSGEVSLSEVDTAFENESAEYASEDSEVVSEESEVVRRSRREKNKLELSLSPDEDEEEYIFFQKTITAIKSWFTLFGWPKGQNPISIPHSLRCDVCKVQTTISQDKVFTRNLSKDKGFCEMLFHLYGESLPGIAASQLLSRDPVERMLQLHWQHSALLSFLKNIGAYLPHVMPEFLLEPEDYKIWIKVKNQKSILKAELNMGDVKTSDRFSDKNIFILEDDTFETVSKRAWTDVLLQIYKVFVLRRVSSHSKTDPSSLESMQNMPRIKPEPLSSNIYSSYERKILTWLNNNYETNRKIVWKDCQKGGVPPRRWIVNFDQDLLDGLVLAAQVAAYCPYLISTHFIRMYTNPRTYQQFLHNCLILVKAMHAVNLNIDIKATDICDPNPVMMLILCVYLYEGLPDYLPKNTIEFTGALHATVIKQVRLKNPSKKPLIYEAILRGRDADDFSLPKGNTVTITPKKQASMNVEFTIRFLRPAEAVLLLTSHGIDAATLTFSLKSEVKHIEPAGVTKCKSPCYELKKVSLNVTNPFKTDGIFRVVLLESTRSFMHPEQVYRARKLKKEQTFSSECNILNSKNNTLSENSSEENNSIYPAQCGLLPEFFSPMEKLFLKGKSSAGLDIHFLPFSQGKRYCNVLLVNEQIGEFVYLIEGTGDIPLPSELPAMDSPNVLHATSKLEDPSASQPVLYLKCSLGQILEENLRIPLINESRERALAMAAQQQMSAVEHERRLMTGTLQSSSVRVATALLGLSTVEKCALLKPRKYPTKYVDYSVEVSMKEFFEVPHKFSIPVLPSTRVNLEAKDSSSQKTDGSDTVGLPIKFTPPDAGSYHCQILLKSPCDVRVYEIECVVSKDRVDAELEFLTPAYQSVIQNIPISNTSSVDWKLEAKLEGEGFYGPPVINVGVGETALYPLTFNPAAEYTTTGRLILRNVTAGTENIFNLKGIGKKPLPQGCIVIDCQAGKVTHKILWVHNYTKNKLTYKVYSDLSMVSGAPVLTCNADDTVSYTLSVSPWRRGTFQGVISFVAQDEDQEQSQCNSSPEKTDGEQTLQKLPTETPQILDAANIGDCSSNCKVWFSLKINSTPAAPEKTIDVRCKALDSIGINIPITNPTDERLEITVVLDNPGLHGPNVFALMPKQTYLYHLEFSPVSLGLSYGSVIFQSDVVGEFWYALRLIAEKASPTSLPEIKCELGKWARLYIPLFNSTHQPLELEILNSNPRNFSIESDTGHSLTVAPHSIIQLPVQFYPSAVGKRNHQARIIFKSAKFQEWIFLLLGTGLPPQLMEPTSISACVGQCSSAIVSFENPTPENVVADVMLTDRELSGHDFNASVLSESTSKESVFHLLFKQPRGIHLAPKEKVNIPVLFVPHAMKMYKAEVVVHVRKENGESWTYEFSGGSNKDLNRNVFLAESGEIEGILWRYPVHGIPEAPQQKLVVVRCRARQRVEQRVEMLLMGVVPDATAVTDARNSDMVDRDNSTNTQEVKVTDGFSATAEFLYELQYQSNEIRSQLESLVGMHLVQKEWDTESGIVTLIFNVVFAPNKPMRNEATLMIQWTAGGAWKFPLQFIATEPEVDDVINIEAVGLNKESVVGFKLTSQTSSPEPFTAHFLAGSDPDFLVMPQAGELLPAGTVGTHITVGYKPRMYGKKHTATLVIETQSMQWTYEINGLPPQNVPPTVAAKVVTTGTYIRSSTVRQRNYLRENRKLITTGVSSPIKGAPLVLRKKQRKL
ncbi:cilia- and flagella-associated protein 47 isoform X1 [Corapipo altera]|uniref:cilia- and flagella-associated protein 47 isoform X1 n=1 Tax=Corapipo altera TaxID=415028 RepID=UPI000FD6B4BF|nr:cilia- and flagella-associated protein 47 isoform X1 [Corapipo altera]